MHRKNDSKLTVSFEIISALECSFKLVRNSRFPKLWQGVQTYGMLPYINSYMIQLSYLASNT